MNPERRFYYQHEYPTSRVIRRDTLVPSEKTQTPRKKIASEKEKSLSPHKSNLTGGTKNSREKR